MCVDVRVPTTSEGIATVIVMEIEGERVDNKLTEKMIVCGLI